ncbi:hypothetical protein DPX39_060049900 [Trypanosoma brucei equiperdum]|uniref:Uncharacterized protein n=1 Tax=Trypanosoma brucei equiperdum TaxID=630700 RepID=A0A3L6L5Y3_9TRYP|nr:hypothetical protein DPX39_060049900 [Trypanosoma brucei equiperdum]
MSGNSKSVIVKSLLRGDAGHLNVVPGSSTPYFQRKPIVSSVPFMGNSALLQLRLLIASGPVAFFWDTVFDFSVPDTCEHAIDDIRSFLDDVVYAWKTSSDIPAPFSIVRDSVRLLRGDGAAFARSTNISLFPPNVVVAVPFFFPPIMQIPQSMARGIYQAVIVHRFH